MYGCNAYVVYEYHIMVFKNRIITCSVGNVGCGIGNAFYSVNVSFSKSALQGSPRS
jgi:hypothetical protein